MIEALQRYCKGQRQADSVPTSPFTLHLGGVRYTVATDGFSYIRIPYIDQPQTKLDKAVQGIQQAAAKKILAVETEAVPLGVLDINLLKEMCGRPAWSKVATRVLSGEGKIIRPMEIVLLNGTYFNVGYLARVLSFWPDSEPTGLYCQVELEYKPAEGKDKEWVTAVQAGSRPVLLFGKSITVCVMPIHPPYIWQDLEAGIKHRVMPYPPQHIQKYAAA